MAGSDIKLVGTTNGVDWTGYAGTGYAWRIGRFEVGPWASIEYNNAQGFAPLNEVASRVGGRVAYHAGKWIPYVQVGWQHNFWDTWTGIDRNAARGLAGVGYRVTDSLWVFGSFQSSNRGPDLHESYRTLRDGGSFGEALVPGTWC